MLKIYSSKKLLTTRLLVEKFIRLTTGIIVTALSLGVFNSCDPCKTKEYLKAADLIIPKVVNIINNGMQTSASNEFYLNETTNEYFAPGFPPPSGIALGDIIQVGTYVLNEWATSQCKEGQDAEQSSTLPTLKGTNEFGQEASYDIDVMPTPRIQLNTHQFTATRFACTHAGSYRMTFNANCNRNLREHKYENNCYYGYSTGGSYGTHKTGTFSFMVTTNRRSATPCNFDVPKTLDDVNNMSLTKAVKSGEFAFAIKIGM